MVERKQSFLESVRDAGGSLFQARAAKKYFQNWLSSRPAIPKFNQVNCNESNLTIGDHFFYYFRSVSDSNFRDRSIFHLLLSLPPFLGQGFKDKTWRGRENLD